MEICEIGKDGIWHPVQKSEFVINQNEIATHSFGIR